MAVTSVVIKYFNRTTKCILLLFLLCLLPKVTSSMEPEDCIFKLSITTKETKYFNLIRLSNQLWQVDVPPVKDQSGKLNGQSSVAFISLCGSLRGLVPSDRCPDPQASVCVAQNIGGKWHNVWRNAGQTIFKKNLSSGGNLSIILDSGQSCDGSRNFTTQILFSCSDEIGSPEFLGISNCSLVVVWPTNAACSLGKSDALLMERCLLMDKGATLVDLRPLYRSDHYTVHGSNGTVFYMNICGTVANNACRDDLATACVINGNNTRIIGMSKSPSLKFADEGLLLLYKASGVRTQVEFVCNMSVLVGEPKLKFYSKETNLEVYEFEFQSSHACRKATVSCVVSDGQNNRYDLSDLSRESGNWEVSSGKNTFFINVCKSLNRFNKCGFTDGPVGACQATTNGSDLNLGVVGKGPELNNGILQIVYSGGALCSDGQSRYRTVIKFQCSDTRGQPILENQSADCVTSFLWPTRLACPRKVVENDDCMMTEPFYNNLTTLHNSARDYRIEALEGSFYVNLCGPLLKPCNGMKNVSICWKNKTQEIAVGYLSKKIKYDDGRLSLELQGDECLPGKKSSVIVLLMCDHEGFPNTSTPEFMEVMEDQCTFLFIWKLRAVCPTPVKSSCKTVDDNGTVYDLSYLSNPSFNYKVVRKTNNGFFKYFINVCQSLVYTYGETCSFSSAVCEYNMSEPNIYHNFKNLGDVKVTQGPKFVDNHLVIEYGEGEVCEVPDSEDHYNTIINFYCNPYDWDSLPQFESVSNCKYTFSWRTAAACPYGHIPDDIIGEGNCTVKNPYNDKQFDLSSLMDEVVNVTSDTGDVLTLKICGVLEHSDCGNGTGACLKKKEKYLSAGIGNAILEYRPGALFLNYSHGDECINGVQRNTLIEFFCGNDNSTQGPQFVDETSNCTTIVQWNTGLACDKMVNCQLSDGNRHINLHSLAVSDNNYIAHNGTWEFYINVCAPLIPVYGMGCTGGSAACAAKRLPNGELVEELSLGFPLISPVLDSNGDVILKYSHGSTCPFDKQFNLSSSIIFSCVPWSGEGQPEFYDVSDDCQYNFLWKTNIICDTQHQPNCTVTDKSLNVSIDLQCLAPETEVKIKPRYLLHLCNTHSTCDGILCKYNKKWYSVGNQTEVKYYPSNSSLSLLITGAPCDSKEGENQSARINIACSKNIGDEEEPTVIHEEDCYVEIEWKTEAICEQMSVINENITSDNSSNASPHTDIASGGINTVALVVSLVVIGAVVILVVFLWQEPNRYRCRRWFYYLMGRRAGDQYLYTRLADNEVQILSPLEGTGSDESDDELLRT